MSLDDWHAAREHTKRGAGEAGRTTGGIQAGDLRRRGGGASYDGGADWSTPAEAGPGFGGAPMKAADGSGPGR